MGWGPTNYGSGHIFLLAMHPLAIVPGKADHPTGRTVGFLVFAYLTASTSDICIVRLRG